MWGEEIKTAYGDLKRTAVIGNFAKRALRVLNHFLDRKGVSGGAPVTQGHTCCLVVELGAPEVNSGRIVCSGVCNSPF